MGLFSKKKSAPSGSLNTASKTHTTVNADDIWNAPVRKNGESVSVKESKFAQAKEESVEGVVSIEPEIIKDKMAQLEKELEDKKNKPVKTYMDYDVNPVKSDEITDAQTEYEKLYAVEHERFLASHKEDISKAQESGLGEKVEKMLEEHENVRITEENTVYEFSQVSDDEVSHKLENLSYAKKPEDYAEYKDIKAVSSIPDEAELDKLGRIDHSGDPDAIGEVSDEQLAAKLKEFEAKYGG